MRICEFCKTFQISHQAVYAKIKKYAAELDGHISKDNSCGYLQVSCGYTGGRQEF